MLDRGPVSVLVLVLGLTWSLGPAHCASPLGAVVHVAPLASTGGEMVRAHFTLAAANPCPDLSGVCAAGEDCVLHLPSPPSNGWCIRQWQKTLPSNYTATVNLGSQVDFYVSIKAGPVLRTSAGPLNRPPYVALPPPLRARVDCPHRVPLSVKDPDGDPVRCRFARADQAECIGCSRYSFIQLNEEKCVLVFTGAASAGQYPVVLMVEDLDPGSNVENRPLSSIPLHLSFSVEEASPSCGTGPIPTAQTPSQDTTLGVLPYQQISVTASFISQPESVVDIAVVGPPDLFRSHLKTNGSATTVTVVWVRGQNKLPLLLPICFSANTNRLQSEPRCLWLHQKEMEALPAGTELKCGSTEMLLVLPVSTLRGVDLAELQLNSPTCPVSHNATHLTARIPLASCGTKKVHFESELIYTNTLQSVRPHTVISRRPALILPLACRIPGFQAAGPRYQIIVPQERETFGDAAFWLEFHFPGKGPLSTLTRDPTFRQLRRMRSIHARQAPFLPESGGDGGVPSSQLALGSKIKQLDLHVMSNLSVDRAELMVGTCVESETEDFAESQLILDQGCLSPKGMIEIVTGHSNSKIYRLDMTIMEAKGTKMMVECTVHLCIPIRRSQRCPDPCARSTGSTSQMEWLLSRTYTVRSRAVSLVVTTPAPTTTTVKTPTPNAPGGSSTITQGPVMTSTSLYLLFFFILIFILIVTCAVMLGIRHRVCVCHCF